MVIAQLMFEGLLLGVSPVLGWESALPWVVGRFSPSGFSSAAAFRYPRVSRSEHSRVRISSKAAGVCTIRGRILWYSRACHCRSGHSCLSSSCISAMSSSGTSWYPSPKWPFAGFQENALGKKAIVSPVVRPMGCDGPMVLGDGTPNLLHNKPARSPWPEIDRCPSWVQRGFISIR